MDLTMNSGGKLIILAVIVAIFGIAGWRMESPDSFHAALADAGLARQAAPAPAPAMVPGTPAPAPDQAPAQQQTPQTPPQDSNDSAPKP